MPIINKAKRAKRLDAKVNKAASKAAPKPKRYTRKEALQDAKTNRVVKKIKAPAVKKITVKTKATKKPTPKSNIGKSTAHRMRQVYNGDRKAMEKARKILANKRNK